MTLKWHNLMAKFTLHPRAVTKQLLANLEPYKPLTVSEEARFVDAIESAGLKIDRVLASLSRDTLNTLLKTI